MDNVYVKVSVHASCVKTLEQLADIVSTFDAEAHVSEDRQGWIYDNYDVYVDLGGFAWTYDRKSKRPTKERAEAWDVDFNECFSNYVWATDEDGKSVLVVG